MTPALLLIPGAVAAAAYAIYRARENKAPIVGVLPGAAPGKTLVARYALGSDEPGPLSGDWARYAGARPELRGSPKNSILATKGLAEQTPEFRARLLDLAEETGIPVDSLAVIMASESGFNPKAVYLKNGKPFAVGLFQLTVGAHQQGFSSSEDLAKVLEWSAEEQIEKVGRPYFARFKTAAAGATPGKMYMLNFLPVHAGQPDDFVLGKKGDVFPEGHKDAGKPTFLGNVYSMNTGFDPKGTGLVTVGAVKNQAAAKARGAKGKRITVDGAIIEARAAKGVAAAAAEVATVAKGVRQKRNEDGSYPLLMSVAGVLRDEVLAGRAREPAWVPVTITRPGFDLTIEVTSDAIACAPAIRITAEDLANEPTRSILAEFGVTSPDSFQLPIYLGCSYDDTIAIARKYGAIAPTQWMWDETYKAAEIKLEPSPLPSGPLMESFAYALAYLGKLGTQLQKQEKNTPTTLVRDVGKGWILSPRLSERGAVNYGWIVSRPTKVGEVIKQAGEAIQSPGATHGATHVDYSQTLVLVRRKAKRGGQTIDLLDFLDSPEGRTLTGETIEKRFLDAFR